MDGAKFQECFPATWKLVKADDDSQVARAQQVKEARAKQAAALEASRQAAKLPQNRVLRAYALYTKVAFCSEVRDGYLAVYISEPEFGRAKVAVKAIVSAALKEDSSLNTDELWNRGRQSVNGFYATQPMCQGALNALLEESPVNTYNIQKP